MATRKSRHLGRTIGAVAGAALMGGIAFTHGTDIALGVVCGAILVGALGDGAVTGTMSPVTLCAVLFALFFCMIGPGCDDYSGTAAIPGALFGALIGRLVFGPRKPVGELE
jgi:hypothetical protein